MLCASNRALHAVWRDRALADKLLAELKLGSHNSLACADFIHIIDTSNSLPARLQFTILRLLPKKFCAGLRQPGNNMEAVVAALVATTPRLGIEHQFLMMDQISSMFLHPHFRAAFSKPDNLTIEAAPMREAYRLFWLELQRVCKHDHSAVAEMLHDWAHHDSPVPDPSDVDFAATCNAFLHYSAAMPARGLYMVRSARVRSGLWHSFFNKMIQSPAEIQNMLLENLIPRIADLKTDVDRHDAFSRVLSAISTLPQQDQYGGLQAVAKCLPCMRDATLNSPLFNRLKHLAIQAHSENLAMSLCLIAHAIGTRPLIERPALFDEILRHVDWLPHNERSMVVAMLAAQIKQLPSETERSNAYDVLLRATDALPKPNQPEAAAQLFGAITCLPDGATRHLRFLDAVKFIRSHPVDSREAMINTLGQAIWCQSKEFLQLHCLDDHLALIRPQPGQEQVKAVSDLYAVELDAHSEDFRYSVHRKLFDTIGTLPQAEQTALLGLATVQAMRIGSPYADAMISSILHHVQAMPEALRTDALQAAARHFDTLIDALNYVKYSPHAVPPDFAALLKMSERLPDDLRLRVLINAKKSFARCPPESIVLAAKTLRDTVNFLPISLIAQLTTLPAG